MKIYSDGELAEILDKDIFHLIGDTADELSLDCYVVGGYVRDIFLGRPSNDIDVVVVGSGIKVADALRRKLGLRDGGDRYVFGTTLADGTHAVAVCKRF